MAKQVLELNNFAGGLNAYSDARDIGDLEFAQNWNAVVSKAGIIKVAGMALPEIETEYITNENFQDGRGLFQFSSDYSLSSIAGNFEIGLTKGTRAGSNSTTLHSLENKESLSTADDFYKNMIMFITEGTGIGESRIITAYDYTGGASERLLTTEAFSVSLDETSKYIIFGWKFGDIAGGDSTNWSGRDGVAKKDFISNAAAVQSILQDTDFDNKYFIFSKKTSIPDEQSSNLGYIEYGSNLTLVPGVTYRLSFDCAAKQRFHNFVSDGDQDPNEGTDTSSFGDKTPWIQLHSTQVADTMGSIKSVSAVAVSTSSAWTDAKTYKNISPNPTNATQGTGATFNIITSNSGNTATFHFVNRGSGYAVGETLTFNNPDWDGTGSVQTASITVASINVTGLALYENSQWKSGIVGNGATSKYISYLDNNYISNGDFQNFNSSEVTNATDNDWVVGNNARAQKLQTASKIYGGHDGTLSLDSMFSGSLDAPEDDSFASYVYQAVQLDEDTLYHLNFLYDAVAPQVLSFFVYNKTQEKYAVSPTLRTSTRVDALNFTATDAGLVNYEFPYEGPISFKTHKAEKSSTTANQKEEYYVGFAAGISANQFFLNGQIDEERTHVRIAGVTLYKGHNDLVSMTNSLNSDLNTNPYSENIKYFSNYSTFFTVPNNYTTATDWSLKIYAGEYGFRNGNILGFTDEQEVYFDNILLSEQSGVTNSNIGSATTGDGEDVITAILNNTPTKSEIVLHSSKSNELHKNKIKWNSSNCQPTFNYINGMLKISDGNFNNSNSNKMFFYTNKTSLLNNFELQGWTARSNVFDTNINFEVITFEPEIPDASQPEAEQAIEDLHSFFINDSNEVNDASQAQALNEKYNGQVGDPTTTNIATQTTLNNQNAGAHAAWYGRNNPQGHVHMYYFDPAMEVNTTSLIDNDNNISAFKMIPRYADFNGIKSNFYSSYEGGILLPGETLEAQSGEGVYDSMIAGGYENDAQELYTGSINNADINNTEDVVNGLSSDVINYPRVNTYPVNRTSDFDSYATEFAKTARTKTQFAFKLNDISEEGFDSQHDKYTEMSTKVSKLELNWSYEIYGHNPILATEVVNQNILDLITIPFFQVTVDIIESSNVGIDDIIDNLNINRLGYNDLISQSNHKIIKTFGAHYDINEVIDSSITELPSGSYSTFNSLNKDAFINNTYEDGECLKLNLNRTQSDGFFEVEILASFSIDSNLNLNKNSVFVISIESFGAGYEFDFNKSLEYKSIIRPLALSTNSNVTSQIANQAGYINSYLASENPRDENKAYYSRTKVNLTKLTYSPVNSSGIFLDEGYNPNVNLVFDIPKTGDSTSWGNREYRLAFTTVNQYNEESNIIEKNTVIGGFIESDDENIPNIPIGQCPTLKIALLKTEVENSYNKKINFYMRDINSEILYKQFYIDLDTLKLHSTTSGITASPVKDADIYRWQLERENLLEFNEVNSYESESMVSQEDALNLNTMTARYKTSVVANNRMYVGNVKQDNRVYGDRMLKSPIGKYNILPASSFIDVAINDGDEITALEYYKDKILQYKKRKVFIINISGDFEFLEQTFDNVGVLQQCSVTKTPYGIVWANKSGCYLYDGERLINLIENKIGVYETTYYPDNYWNVGSNVPVIAYSQKDDIIVIKISSKSTTIGDTFKPDSYTYHFPTKSWMFNVQGLNDTSVAATGAISNMITNKDGDIIFYNGTYNGVKKLYYEPKVYYQGAETTTSGSSTNLFTFTTKDFTFGNIANRKKIYKIYVTYKTKDGNNSRVLIRTAINGADFTSSDGSEISTSSKFAGTSTACYHHTNGLLDTGGAWKTAELKFTNPGNFSKVNSLQLMFYSALIDPAFEINDISISFRTKRVR